MCPPAYFVEVWDYDGRSALVDGVPQTPFLQKGDGYFRVTGVLVNSDARASGIYPIGFAA